MVACSDETAVFLYGPWREVTGIVLTTQCRMISTTLLNVSYRYPVIGCLEIEPEDNHHLQMSALRPIAVIFSPK